MKILKKIIITFLTAIVTVMLVYGGYAIYAEDTDYYAFTDASKDFSSVQSAYHKSINKYFNDKLEQLYKIMKEEDFYKNINFNAPKDVDSFNATSSNYYTEKCTKENVSTYCVSMGALDLYTAYLWTLNAVKGKLPTVTGTNQPVEFEQMLNQISARDTQMEKEITDAKKVMEAAVAIYDEFRRAYPMHKKLEQIIKTLTKYRIALEKITKTVTTFPLRFVDATSSQCE